jgi:hypothetical protein
MKNSSNPIWSRSVRQRCEEGFNSGVKGLKAKLRKRCRTQNIMLRKDVLIMYLLNALGQPISILYLCVVAGNTCLCDLGGVHCLCDLGGVNCLRDLGGVHCLCDLGGVNCLRDLGGVHCLCDLGGVNCLRDLGGVHCLR